MAVGDDSLVGPSNHLSARVEAGFSLLLFQQGQTGGSSVLWHINTIPPHQIHSRGFKLQQLLMTYLRSAFRF